MTSTALLVLARLRSSYPLPAVAIFPIDGLTIGAEVATHVFVVRDDDTSLRIQHFNFGKQAPIVEDVSACHNQTGSD